MEITNRFCRKCLTRDMKETDYFQNMYDYIEGLDQEIKTDHDSYENRLDVCRQCERLLSGMCNACGCYVELRAAIKENSCPYQKW